MYTINPYIDERGYHKGNDIALAIGCNSEEDTRKLFSPLGKDGKILKSLQQQPWGGFFGSLEDQYGITWFLNYEQR